MTTGIEWVTNQDGMRGETWNPVAGCTRVSPGCRHCYAEVMARRLAAMGGKKYQGTIDKNGRWSGVLNRADDKAFNEPLRNKKPTVYFVNSMSDLLHENIPLETLTDIFEIMAKTPQHTYQVLTKRADRLWLLDRQVAPGVAYRLGRQKEPGFWPLPNVWLGVSVENQQYADERIPELLKVPAAVRFLSVEPMLGPVNLNPYFWHNGIGFRLDNSIDWVIVGGESGVGARPMHPEWARRIRDDCTAAGTAFFFKQHGEYIAKPQIATFMPRSDWGSGWEIKPEWKPIIQGSRWGCLDISGKYHPETTTWNGRQNDPQDDYEVTVYKVGKHAAGRLLDGRTWDEFPHTRPA